MPADPEPLPPATPADTRKLLWLIPALGIGQIIAWGTLFYSLAVLAKPIRAELGFSELLTFGAFTLGLLTSGAAAPYAGRWIDRYGGRRVMAGGSLVAAAGFVVLGLASGPVGYVAGWLLAGFAMASCLYDPAFASLHQIAPHLYRRAVSGLTLFGGFASTVFWPLANLLAERWGWREAFFAFAALHLLVCLPIYLALLPSLTGGRAAAASAAAPNPPPPFVPDRRYYWLATSFALATFILGAMASFLITALVSRGFTMEQAVWIAALVGPMQVAGRIAELTLAARIPATRVGIVALSVMSLALLLLTAMPDAILLGCLFAAAYGSANGVITIVRGTVPPELFGRERQGSLLGGLARPAFFSMAIAPALFAGALGIGVPMTGAIAALAGIAVAALGCFLVATRLPAPVKVYRE
ncbi:MAG TPA: MFS transporter, partial [Burkholderiales bacterium]